MFDESSELSARLFFLLEECLEYGLVVPFPAYGFASLVSHNESLNSLNSLIGERIKAKRCHP